MLLLRIKLSVTLYELYINMLMAFLLGKQLNPCSFNHDARVDIYLFQSARSCRYFESSASVVNASY
jgi:hypothetical protein